MIASCPSVHSPTSWTQAAVYMINLRFVGFDTAPDSPEAHAKTQKVGQVLFKWWQEQRLAEFCVLKGIGLASVTVYLVVARRVEGGTGSKEKSRKSTCGQGLQGLSRYDVVLPENNTWWKAMMRRAFCQTPTSRNRSLACKQFFVAALFRKHIVSVCRTRCLQPRCTADWSSFPFLLSLLFRGKSHLEKLSVSFKSRGSTERQDRFSFSGEVSFSPFFFTFLCSLFFFHLFTFSHPFLKFEVLFRGKVEESNSCAGSPPYS